MERRREPRLVTNLLLRAWGMGSDGHTFFQDVQTDNISSLGAKISGIEHQIRPGDVIGLQLPGDGKARFRVVWMIGVSRLLQFQAGLQLVEGQQCLWTKELAEGATSLIPSHKDPLKNNRRFERLKLHFPLEFHDETTGSRMQTNATDISGRGCYVETLLPLARGTELDISFWIDSSKVDTTGIVRASDGGVGMGIEFTGLDLDSQQHLQHYLEKLKKQNIEPDV